MRRWLAKRFPHAPFNRAIDVDVDEMAVHCQRASGLRDSFFWASLQRVSIRTTDRGPFDDDVFVVLEEAGACCWIPQPIALALVSRLQQLPGFDNEAMIEAMSSVENDLFVCWTAEAAAEPQ